MEIGTLDRRNPISIFWSFLNSLAYDGSFKMYTLSDNMAQVIKTNYLSKNNLGTEVRVLPLWVDTVNFNPISKVDNKFLNSLELAEKFIVLYSGNMGLSQDLKGLDSSTFVMQRIKLRSYLLVMEPEKRK